MLLKQQLDVIDTLRKCNEIRRPVYIRGTGKGALLIFNELKNLGIKVAAFVDIKGDRHTFLGLNVLPMESVYRSSQNCFVVCGQLNMNVYFEVRKELESHGLVERKDFYNFGYLGFSFARQDDKTILQSNFTDGRARYLSVENKTILFDQLLIIPNSTCSLRCKYCATGVQYAARKVFDSKQTVEDYDKLLSICKTKVASIQGGEIFLNPDLSNFFGLFAEMKNINNCEQVEVFTNATIVPTDEQLAAYSRISLPKRFVISNYGLPNVKTDKFIAKIKEFGLDYRIHPPDFYWFHPGDPRKETGYTVDELKDIINRCTKFARTTTVMDGKFFACCQQVHALYDKSIDFIDIRNINRSKLENEIYNYMFNKESYDFCGYCRGEYENNEKIPPAEQLQ
ncbi:MAG: hypothetical protein LBU32_11605 [Clostridiales bacterium]|jgi:hypothetical protein|nr:hypothetical protein [Clostridiales bacterium]